MLPWGPPWTMKATGYLRPGSWFQGFTTWPYTVSSFQPGKENCSAFPNRMPASRSRLREVRTCAVPPLRLTWNNWSGELMVFC